ncbi:MAG: hypothetical protein ACXVAM_04705 [Vulcanimicrobiaceae bacterium]
MDTLPALIRYALQSAREDALVERIGVPGLRSPASTYSNESKPLRSRFQNSSNLVIESH